MTTKPRASRTPHALFTLITLTGLATLAACGEIAEPDADRSFTAISADAQPLPYTAACPPPQENSEAWVSFGSGLLELDADARFAWTFQVGSGYRTWTPGPNGTRENIAQVATGASRRIEGSWQMEADGTRSLQYERAATADTPLDGSGYVGGATAYIDVPIPCPQAPAGTPPHVFKVVLLENVRI